MADRSEGLTLEPNEKITKLNNRAFERVKECQMLSVYLILTFHRITQIVVSLLIIKTKSFYSLSMNVNKCI
jgi:hypothetical protein